MIWLPRFPRRRVLLCLAATCAALTTSCLPFSPQSEEVCDDGCPDCKAAVCKNPTMMALACDLDKLDDHIDKYGSVVIKQPDVWGQARLTQYREEFEAQMRIDLNQFQERLQGSVNRQDQAFFAQAFSLSAAISGPGPTTTYPAGTVLSGTSTATKTSVQVPNPAPAAPPLVPTQGQGANTPAPLDVTSSQVFSSTAGPAAFPGTAPGFVTALAPSTSGAPTAGAALGISLEPTIVLEQKARYLDHLNQIRRTNEGDDTADSPGYSMNLVRIPVSVLPGKRTRLGHAAEVTITMTPLLGDELLPTTFRNLVLNDLVDQIGVPLTQLLNDKSFVKEYLIDDQYPKALEDEETESPSVVEASANNPARPTSQPEPHNDGQGQRKLTRKERMETNPLVQRLESAHWPAIPATKIHRAKLPFPPSQILDIYGLAFSYRVAYDAHQSFSQDAANRDYVHLPDVQGYLQEEIGDAYRFVADPKNADLWVNFCTPELISAIRAWPACRKGRADGTVEEIPQVDEMRMAFRAAVRARSGDNADSITAALAWTIIVESALLTDQLVLDMKESAAAKGCACPYSAWLDYYMPLPSAEARQAFNEYVRCRWPIHVFALDPSTDDQNLADQDTTRREMQLALSLAFVSGKMNANSLTRYARRLDAQYDTIDINRTAVGFSHGENTFGWRFNPRFQTPDTESNAQVFFRDMLVGGPTKDQLLRERRLEPGIRDCVAIVMMPSFVPYVTCDVSSDWINVTDPKCKLMDCEDAVRLSRRVKAIQNCACNVHDADCYRDGDLGRLMRKAEQLEARLPLQTQTVQVPYENTLGGFAMFNNGITDLAPELYGWYGAPAIRTDAATAVFLMGNHFSVKQTRVIAGGMIIDPRVQNPQYADAGTSLAPLPSQESLSRQVLRVVIPAGAQTIQSDGRFFVDVQVATPYGVTSHLLIPAVNLAGGPAPPSGWKANPVTVSYITDLQKSFAATSIDPAGDLVINLNPSDVPDGMAAANVTLTMTTPYPNVQFAFNPVDYDAKQRQLTIKSDAFLNTLGPTFQTKFLNDAAHPKTPETVVAQTLIDPLGSDKKTSLKKGLALAAPLTVKWQQAPPAAASWITDQVAVSYVFADKAVAQASISPTAPATLAISLTPAADTPSFTKANLQLTVSKPAAATLNMAGDYNAVNHVVTIDGGTFAKELFKQVGNALGADSSKPPADVTVTSTVVDPLDAAGKSLDRKVTASNNLTIKWQKSQ